MLAYINYPINCILATHSSKQSCHYNICPPPWSDLCCACLPLCLVCCVTLTTAAVERGGEGQEGEEHQQVAPPGEVAACNIVSVMVAFYHFVRYKVFSKGMFY